MDPDPPERPKSPARQLLFAAIKVQWPASHGKCRVSSLSVFLQDIARKLHFWSNTTLDLAAGSDLRQIATALEEKAQECSSTDCAPSLSEEQGASEMKNPR